MKAIAFYGDSSDYSKDLSRELRDSGWEVVGLDGPDGLEGLPGENLLAIVVVNPRVRLAKVLRDSVDNAGGIMSLVPLMAALGDPELMSEVAMLKYFDDFVVAPGGEEELSRRIEVLTYRSGGRGNAIRAGDLVINIDEHRVLVGGRPVDFTYKEFELIKMMASTPGRAYSREELLRSIWGYDYFGGTRTVDVHVRRIRAKIEHSRRYIETVHGLGYRFIS